MTKEAIAKAPESRVRRSPLGRKQILNAVGKNPEFEYRFVNDDGDRISRMLEAGWELTENVKVGDKRVENVSQEGSNVQVSVGRGMKAYLMRIKKEWYQEDQAAKQAQVDESESSMKRQALDGTYGTLEISRR